LLSVGLLQYFFSQSIAIVIAIRFAAIANNPDYFSTRHSSTMNACHR